MTYYLVDTENVQTAWHDFTHTANDNDVFLLFYSTATCKISMNMFGPACLRNIQFKFIECYTGPNGMDFQLATELGYIISQHPDASFVIISKDMGYDVLVRYWNDRHVRVERQEPMPVSKQATEPEIIKQTYKDKLKPHNLSDNDCDVAVEIMYKTMAYPQNSRKLETFNQFQKHYGSKTGLDKYTKIKDVIKEIAVNGPLPPQKDESQTPTAKKKRKTKLLEQVKQTCPELKSSEQDKVVELLHSIIQNKQMKSRETTYENQLKSKFGKKAGKQIFKVTQHLLEE